MKTQVFLLLCALCPLTVLAQEPSTEVLPGTARLTWDGDLASQMIEGIDRFLLRKIEGARRDRAVLFSNDQLLPPRHDRIDQLRKLLGVRDERVKLEALDLIAATGDSAVVATLPHFVVKRVRWRSFSQVHGEGLMLEPRGKVAANLVVIPDAEQTPEGIYGGYPGQLVAAGCRVVIPAIVSRRIQNRRAELTDREFIYRSAFELGRQITGYELQKVLSIVDWYASTSEAPIGVMGWGEGGRLALYAAAVSEAVDLACVSGYFGARERIWEEPLDRNVFGLLNAYGDAEIAHLISPRRLVIDAAQGPEASVRTKGGAPYDLRRQALDAVSEEIRRAQSFQSANIELVDAPAIARTVSEPAVRRISQRLNLTRSADDQQPISLPTIPVDSTRQDRMVAEMDRHNQQLLVQSPYVRKEFFKDLKLDSLEAHASTVENYREYFRTHVIGAFDDPLLDLNPRTRKVFDTSRWTGFEVVLDVYPDVFAFGILLLPKDLKPGEQRPVVVCQHGLEGRPRHVIEQDHRAYHDFAAKLAERGFITFAPQNIYIFRDRFRTLQRKANPLGKTLFSIMVPQHQQIVNWLAQQPYVDADRIAFYGLSYGGKSAMRIPPLVDEYCLSICSADFNDWVWKNASTLSPYSYVWTGEYEIFEWDLGSTFNYAEMAALIAPRPFMVERGHFDGVAPDERVAYEFAKVRHLYQAQLGIGDRCEIEFFVGPHTINGQGTFDFLHRHLNWPEPD